MIMETDTAIKIKGMKALTDNLGMVDASRFIMLLQRDSSAHIKRQCELFEDDAIVADNFHMYTREELNER